MAGNNDLDTTTLRYGEMALRYMLYADDTGDLMGFDTNRTLFLLGSHIDEENENPIRTGAEELLRLVQENPDSLTPEQQAAVIDLADNATNIPRNDLAELMDERTPDPSGISERTFQIDTSELITDQQVNPQAGEVVEREPFKIPDGDFEVRQLDLSPLQVIDDTGDNIIDQARAAQNGEELTPDEQDKSFDQGFNATPSL